MLRTLLLAGAVIIVCVAAMCFNIIFRRNGRFPETEISRNRELRKRGIRCVREEEIRLWRRKNGREPSCSELDCRDCGVCNELNTNKNR